MAAMSVLERHDVVVIRADNPGPFTLTGTNTWVIGRERAWVIDPGPALPVHVEAVVAEVERRGGLAGIALTHDHPDLAAGARSIDELLDAAWADAPAILRPAATVTLAAHLDKLADEGRLPEGVERPGRPPWLP